MTGKSVSALIAENEALRVKLEDSEEILHAIRSGQVDSLVIMGDAGEQIFTLQGADQAYRILVENMSEGALTVNPDGMIIYANKRFADMLKVPLEKVIGTSLYLWIASGSQQILRSLLAMGAGNNSRRELHLVASDNLELPTQVSASFPAIQGVDHVIFLLVTDLSEINEFKKREQELTRSASVFTNASEGILITDACGNIVDVNAAFTRITSYTREEVLGRNPKILGTSRQDKQFFTVLWGDLKEKGHWSGEIWNRRKNGEMYVEMLKISALCDNNGTVLQYIGMFSDITAMKEHEKYLEHTAYYDSLTNLPNRVLLSDRMQQGMVQSLRRERPLAVVFLDLDGFKAINDKHGHAVGDRLLITLSSRMKATLREGDTLSRIGGDEFVALLLDIDNIAGCEPTLKRLLAATAQAVQIDNLVLQVTASLGVTIYPQEADIQADQLVRQADQAMYQAKITGKNRFCVFDPTLDTSLRSYHVSLERIQRAIIHREFVLYYQPKVNMRTGVVIGAEALIRWQHPEKGLLLPAEFLPLIEDHPLIVELGDWVIDNALMQIEIWAAHGLFLSVSINISARQLQQAGFVDRVRSLLAAHPTVIPGFLEMEILENSALQDLIRVSHVIDECRTLGVLFALDDFGTGYSSLTYLKRLPVKWLKIDQSFVRDMLDDPDDLSILTGVLSLAQAFRREVIAEGVETVAHGAMLLQLGCELAQGYGIARPIPAAALPGWVLNWRNEPAWNNLLPVIHADLPLLFASTEHRAWVATIESFLRGERVAPMPLDHHACRFGAWLDAVPTARHEMQPVIKAIAPLHLKIHDIAAELLELHSPSQNTEELARVAELDQLMEMLLEQLILLNGSSAP
ncbi:EAL domain-containing protein [Actimicrobium sp. CCI2.3]|uniref:EAL domain-containing protein n=1 Tax=Actimicrobium sp. CCI2.3 TaxID=3048616 RepID=UPI002AB40AA8|nr:EAL domain-containing protein [Actimicrobium sp. CCI2.3]MDY7575528.1 EAL domain-containing protein [Actimicrobium sp. CCI2.3]MEB0022791.1 EAL domain-containing protein [Actimicrobium sp. CCI2.3]